MAPLGHKTDALEGYWRKSSEVVLVFPPCDVVRSDNDKKRIWLLTIFHGNQSPSYTTPRHSGSDMVSRVARENTVNSRIDQVSGKSTGKAQAACDHYVS